MGPLDYMTTLNAAVLEHRLSGDGLDVTVALSERDAGEWFVRATHGEQRITLPSPAREQVLIEGLTIASLRSRLRWFTDNARRSRPSRNAVAVQFAGEDELWSASSVNARTGREATAATLRTRLDTNRPCGTRRRSCVGLRCHAPS